MTTAPPLKRRRVTRACDSCRSLKAKCDGVQPTCSRCDGYGYACTWNAGGRRKEFNATKRVGLESPSMESQMLRDAIVVYNDLVKDLRPTLSPDDRKLIDIRLASIQLPDSLTELSGNSALKIAAPAEKLADNDPSLLSQRFLGEASDIHFFHAVESAFCQHHGLGQDLTEASDARVESYEQECRRHQGSSQNQGHHLPRRTTANKFVNIYFSTIHNAYPFISEPDFRKTYESFWQQESLRKIPGPWLSLLLTIFAIGACYEGIAEPDDNDADNAGMSHQHQRYFEHATAIAQKYTSKHTVEFVCALLAQCFYLLATCQTDRCWTTLGLAVRIAQSIGLHVEDEHCSGLDRSLAPREQRRRVWYSIFILDRLVAMQLGRPPAVCDRNFNVRLPSRQFDTDLVDVTSPSDNRSEYWAGDYFIALIEFSGIIGQVFNNLYGPRKSDDAASTLSTIDRLNFDLLQWRSNLPRNLRFDLAHTFEKSTVYKRQRNMLAMKFYNLQALIHRPFLALSKMLESCPTSSAFYQTEGRRISLSKRTCVMSAQHTAKLLHNLEDKKSLVYGFPWWQMISCLLCASSILLVAPMCVDPDMDEEQFKEIDWSAVDEDADVCLKVFEALSPNSNAARLASDMMQRLKKTRMMSQGGRSTNCSEMELTLASTVDNGPNTMTDPSTFFDPVIPSSIGLIPPSQDSFNLMFQGMPYEVSEPVVWSAQFVNTAYNPFSTRGGS